MDIEVLKTEFSGKFHRKWQKKRVDEKIKRERETKRNPSDGQLCRGMRGDK